MTTGVVRVDANRLEAMLRERGITQVALAEQLGLHQNTIVKIKKTGSTNLGTLESICNALHCHPFDLLVAEGYPEPFSLA